MSVRGLFAVGVAALLAGCATSAPDMSRHSDQKYAEYPVPVESVRVDNFAQGKKPTGFNYTAQYSTLGDDATSPPFTHLVHQRVSQQLVAEGVPGSGVLEIAILEASLQTAHLVADRVPFISLAAALSPRDHRCYVDANFRFGDLSVRQTFDAIKILPRSWSDSSVEVKQAMVEECLSEILEAMQEFSTRLARKD